MRTIEMEGTVSPDGDLHLRVPAPGITPGKHRLLIVIDEQPTSSEPISSRGPLDLPSIPVGRWQSISLRREDMYDDSGR